MTIKLTTLDLFNALYNICKNYPQTFIDKKELRCLRPNTFAVVWRFDQIDTANISKDTRYLDKGLFYSRIWEENNQNPSALKYDYPALVIAEGNSNMQDVFQKGMTERVTFNLMLHTKMPQNTNVHLDLCEMKTAEERAEDLRQMMKNIITQLGSYQYATVNLSAGGTQQGWFPLAYLENSSEVDSYQCMGEMSSFFQDTATASKFYQSFADDLISFVINITLDLSECDGLMFEYNNLQTCTQPDKLVH